jgi:transcription antitermination factor NusG
LSGLRRIEAKRTPRKRAAYSFPKNAAARVASGIFGGMKGTVIRSTPMKTVIHFGNGVPVEFATSLLSMDEVRESQIAVLKAA